MEKDLMHILKISFFHSQRLVIRAAAVLRGSNLLPGYTQWELSSGEWVQPQLLRESQGRRQEPRPRSCARTAGGFSEGSANVLGPAPGRAVGQTGSSLGQRGGGQHPALAGVHASAQHNLLPSTAG